MALNPPFRKRGKLFFQKEEEKIDKYKEAQKNKSTAKESIS
jgi:hypothetical protein